MSLPPFSKLEPALYRWHQSSSDPTVTQRLAVGTEAWVGRNAESLNGQWNFRIESSVRITSDIVVSLKDLRTRFVLALLNLRHQHPEVALTAAWHDGNAVPHLQYKPVQSHEEALAWAEKHVVAHQMSNGLPHHQDVGHNGAESVMIYLHQDNTSTSQLNLYIAYNHLFWDGDDSKAFIGTLLQCVNSNWDNLDSVSGLRWGTEQTRLSPSPLDETKIDMESLGGNFEKIREEMRDLYMRGVSTSWGLPVAQPTKPGKPCVEIRRLTSTQSSAIIKAIKTRLGPQYTINHLAHAALALALLEMNPLDKHTAAEPHYTTPTSTSARRYLKDATLYGIHQSGGAVVDFRPLQSYAPAYESDDAVRAALDKGAKLVQKTYRYFVDNEVSFPAYVSFMNWLVALTTSGITMPAKSTSVPVFLPDGRVDRFVPHKAQSPGAQVSFEVETCDLLMNVFSDSLTIRLQSFRGAQTLSFEFNDAYYKTEAAAKFLGITVGYMLQYAGLRE